MALRKAKPAMIRATTTAGATSISALSESVPHYKQHQYGGAAASLPTTVIEVSGCSVESQDISLKVVPESLKETEPIFENRGAQRDRAMSLWSFNFEERLIAVKDQVNAELRQFIDGIPPHIETYSFEPRLTRVVPGIASMSVGSRIKTVTREVLDGLTAIAQRIIATDVAMLSEGNLCPKIIKDILSIIHNRSGGIVHIH